MQKNFYPSHPFLSNIVHCKNRRNVNVLKASRKTLIITATIFMIILFQNYFTLTAKAEPSFNLPFDYAKIVNRLNIENIKRHAKYLSNLGSRYTLSRGYEKAAQYIYEELNKTLDKVWFQPYNGTFYVDYGANLTMPNGTVLTLYPLLPNGVVPVTTPPEGIKGRLVYVGDGNLEELEGKEINGSIVLMNFNTNSKWLDIARFGAKAVIFIEPDFTVRNEAEQKRLYEIPFNFPRFYIKKELVHELLSIEGQEVTIKSTCRWENGEAKNIVGYLLGEEEPEHALGITTYFDSNSIVPSIAPGASESLGVSLMLEVARLLAEERPKVTVLFVVFSGHHQGLWGAREWAFQMYYKGYAEELGFKVHFYINLDINTDTDKVFPIATGGFYYIFQHEGGILSMMPYEGLAPPVTDGLELFLKIIDQWEKQTGRDYGISEIDFRTAFLSEMNGLAEPIFFKWYDHEVLGHTTVKSISLATYRSWHTLLGTPLDEYEQLNFNNLVPQAEFIWAVLYSFANSNWILFFPVPEDFQRLRSEAKLIDVEGEVLEWNERENWYMPVSEAIVLCIRTQNYDGALPRHPAWVVKTDKNGRFSVHLVPGAPERVGKEYGSFIWLAYKLDSYGNIIYGPDQGIYAFPGFNRLKHPSELKIAVFNCSTIVMFNPIDPQVMDVEPEYPIFMTINDIRSHLTLKSRGTQYEYAPGGYFIAIAYVPPNVPVEILVQNAYSVLTPFAVLTNSTKDNPMGVGYKLKRGQQLTLINTQLIFARDLYWLTKVREEDLVAKGVSVDTVLGKNALTWINRTYAALRDKDYSLALSFSYKAWQASRNFYLGIETKRRETVNTVPFFAFLLIPFAYFIERLLFSFSGYRRLMCLIAIYFLTLTAFLASHPGFLLVVNLGMTLIGLLGITISAILFAFIARRTSGLLREVRKEVLGLHWVEIDRGGAFIQAFSYGIGHMKKRKLRTSLTLVLLVIIESSLVSFLSMKPLQTITPIEQPISTEALQKFREGILMRRPEYGPPILGTGIGIDAIRFLKYLYREDAMVVPRMWLWPPIEISRKESVLKLYNPVSGQVYTKIRGIVGLTPEEAEITNITVSILNGRWIAEYDTWSIIIPDTVADALNVSVGDKVSLAGIPFRVIGIFDHLVYDQFIDIDQWPISPPDFSEAGVPLWSEETVIIPLQTCLSLAQVSYQSNKPQAFIASLAIKPKDPSRTLDLAKEIFKSCKRYEFFVVAEKENAKRLFLISQLSIVTVTGFESMIPALIISVLSILNLMMGVVYERKREIMTLSLVGLSPLHVSAMFLAEPVILGIMGGIIGYIGAAAIIKLMINLAPSVGLIIPPVDFSSVWAAVAVATVIVAPLGSSIYPLITASKLVTPSLMRKWEMPTKPRGDLWEIPLPFVIGSRKESRGIINYLYEFFEAHASPTSEDFVVESLDKKEETREGADFFILTTRVRLTPQELGVVQNVDVTIRETEPGAGLFNVALIIRRLGGSMRDWTYLNRKFVDAVRKQLFLWRSLTKVRKLKYEEGV